MKSLSELTDFYYKVLFPSLKKLEKDRKHLRYRIVLVILIFTFLVAVVVFSLQALFQSIESLGFIIVLYIAGVGFLYKMLTKDYTLEFKEKIMSPMINEIDSNLNYTPSLHVSQRLFERSKLFTSSIDRMSGNDFVKGKIDTVSIQFSDIHAEKQHKDSKGRTSWSTIFQGLFIVSEFNKHFKGQTVVLPDSAQSSFGDIIGSWLQSNNISRDELVKMDNTEFEKEFVVYSSDQVEARYILSHTLMDKLLNFKKRSKHPVYISFVGESIHMAIEYNKDLFEPSVFRSLLDYKISMEYVQTLHLAIGIVQELKLNQRLWSKQ